jgi:hypothetical protein
MPRLAAEDLAVPPGPPWPLHSNALGTRDVDPDREPRILLSHTEAIVSLNWCAGLE